MGDLVVSGASEIADWIEVSLLLRGRRQLGGDALHRLALEELDMEPPGVSMGTREMGRRRRLLGELYPFEDKHVALRAAEGAAESSYAALLMLSPRSPYRQLLSPTPTEQMAVAFERLAAEAAARLLGPGSRSLRFGWPSDAGRPPDFNGAIHWLAREMRIDPGVAYRPPRRKDGGVDVVAWRPFADGRSGFPMLLVQCTLQAEVRSKALDIDLVNWTSWLALDRAPLTALAVAHILPPGEGWDEVALHTIPLDRLRVCELIGSGSPQPEITDVVAVGLERLADLMKGAEA